MLFVQLSYHPLRKNQLFHLKVSHENTNLFFFSRWVIANILCLPSCTTESMCVLMQRVVSGVSPYTAMIMKDISLGMHCLCLCVLGVHGWILQYSDETCRTVSSSQQSCARSADQPGQELCFLRGERQISLTYCNLKLIWPVSMHNSLRLTKW